MLEVQLCQLAWVGVRATLKSLGWDVLTASAGQPTGTDWDTLFFARRYLCCAMAFCSSPSSSTVPTSRAASPPSRSALGSPVSLQVSSPACTR